MRHKGPIVLSLVPSSLSLPQKMPFSAENDNGDGDAKIVSDKQHSFLSPSLPSSLARLTGILLQEGHVTLAELRRTLQGWTKEWSLGCVNPAS